MLPADEHQDFLVGLVDVVSNRFGESPFILDFVHSFSKLVCTEMKSVYTDLIDWLIFSGHQFVFSVYQFLKISVNRYTGF